MCAARLARQAARISASSPGRAIRSSLKNDVGDDESANDRVLSRVDPACAHRLMRIERRLHLFRMNLGAADIDDSAAPADKIQPVPALLDHVARVDEAVLVRERGFDIPEEAQGAPVRAHAQGPADDLDPDRAISVQPGCRKARIAVIDREDDAGLGRGVGVLDARTRVGFAKGAQDGVVRDLAGQPDVIGRDAAGLGAHQDLTPVRRRAKDMGDLRLAEADEEGIQTFPCGTELKRTPAAESAEQYLQPPVAADVIEGRPLLQRRFRDRGRQRAQSMRHELGRSARARRRQNPFGFAPRLPGPFQLLQRQSAGRSDFDGDRRVAVRAVHDRNPPPRRAWRPPVAKRPIPAGREGSGGPSRQARSGPRRLGHVVDRERHRAALERGKAGAEA